jgi:tetratricopeptide (TPR) repeat protein
MKTINIIPLLLAAIVLLASRLALANDKYLETMQKNIETIYASKDVAEIQQVINTFVRVGEAEKTKWEPFYYAGYGYVMLAMREQTAVQKDTYLDLALQHVERAKTILSTESEAIALEGFIHMIRVSVDPASRGQQYSGLAMQAFGKAVALNPENPRALALLAQMQYGTAQFFGAPTTEACSTLAKALEKFDSYKSENLLSPQWGRKLTEGLKSKCN